MSITPSRSSRSFTVAAPPSSMMHRRPRYSVDARPALEDPAGGVGGHGEGRPGRLGRGGEGVRSVPTIRQWAWRRRTRELRKMGTLGPTPGEERSFGRRAIITERRAGGQGECRARCRSAAPARGAAAAGCANQSAARDAREPADDDGAGSPMRSASDAGEQAADRRGAEERHRVERHHAPAQLLVDDRLEHGVGRRERAP